MAKNRLIPALVVCLLMIPVVQASEVSDMVARATEHFEMAEIEQAQALLEEALSRGVSPDEALQVRTEVGTRVFLKMLRNDVLNAPVKQVLKLAAEAERANLTSPDLLKSFVEDLEADFAGRQLALQKLAGAGDVAVPYLLDLLSDPVSDERRTYAHIAIARLGTKALWPLLAALSTDDRMLRTNICVALGNIGDPRAVPYLKQIVDDSNQLEDVRERAKDSLSRIMQKQAARLPDAATLFSNSAENMLRQLPRTQAAFDHAPARIWWWENGKLQSQELPASLAKAEIVRAQSLKAIEINPDSRRAAGLFVCSTLAFSLLADQTPNVSDIVKNELQRYLAALHIFGPNLLGDALGWFMAEGWDNAALLGLREIGVELDTLHSTFISPPREVSAYLQPILAEAMTYPNTLVRAKAMALFPTITTGYSSPENAPELIAMAIATLNASVEPAIMVAATDGEIRNRFASALRDDGFDVVEAQSPAEATEAASKRLRFYALIVEENFTRGKEQLRRFPSLRRAAVFVVAQSPSAESAKAAWPGATLVFAGSEAPEYIRNAVGQVPVRRLTEENVRDAHLNAAKVLQALSQAAGDILQKHIPDLEPLVNENQISSAAAVTALAATGKIEAFPALQSASTTARQPGTRGAALVGIAGILRDTSGEPNTVLPLFLEASRDEDGYVARAARIAIGLLNLQPGRAAAIYQRIAPDVVPYQPSD